MELAICAIRLQQKATGNWPISGEDTNYYDKGGKCYWGFTRGELQVQKTSDLPASD
jgi:hypothetical protein